MTEDDDNAWELIDDAEPPLGIREFERVLSGSMTRGERRKAWKALREADLLVFRA